MKSQKSGAGAANLWQKLAFLAQDYRSRTMREAALKHGRYVSERERRKLRTETKAVIRVLSRRVK